MKPLGRENDSSKRPKNLHSFSPNEWKKDLVLAERLGWLAAGYTSVAYEQVSVGLLNCFFDALIVFFFF